MNTTTQGPRPRAAMRQLPGPCAHPFGTSQFAATCRNSQSNLSSKPKSCSIRGLMRASPALSAALAGSPASAERHVSLRRFSADICVPCPSPFLPGPQPSRINWIAKDLLGSTIHEAHARVTSDSRSSAATGSLSPLQTPKPSLPSPHFIRPWRTEPRSPAWKALLHNSSESRNSPSRRFKASSKNFRAVSTPATPLTQPAQL